MGWRIQLKSQIREKNLHGLNALHRPLARIEVLARCARKGAQGGSRRVCDFCSWFRVEFSGTCPEAYNIYFF